MSARKQQKHEARVRRLEFEAALRERGRRKRRRSGLAAAVTAVLAVGGGAAVLEGVPNRTRQAPALAARELASLASLGKLTPAGTIDGIRCQGNEQVVFHIHAHLTMFVKGAPRRIPYGIGIPGAQVTPTPTGPFVAAGGCFYWLHTHAADGIIHIESPVQRTYTLGDFFDVWGQRLTATRVGAISGPVTALYNGHVFRGNPREVPLTKHAQIQLEVGRPLIAPVEISFPAGL
jgi:hypothetical protein